MKTIKLKFIALAILVLGAFIFTGCSDDGSMETPDNSMLNYRITNENAFIDEFYGNSWRTGVSASVRDSLNTYVVTEIIVGSDTRARGYLVKDGVKGDLLYFADVDRTGYVMKTVDLITEEWETITDIDKHPDYSISDEFDFIQVVDDVNNDNVAPYWSIGVTIKIALDNFWATTADCGTPYYDSGLNCVQDCTYQKRRFWIVWSSTTIEGVPATGC